MVSVLLELLRAYFYSGFARAESCFVEGAREMLANKQYVAPLFYGVPYFDKPPLHYWLLISFYKIVGISLFAARAVSTIAAVATVSITAIFVKKILGTKVALLSAIVLTTTIGFFEFSAVAMPDMLLSLFESLSIFSAYIIFFDNSKHRLSWLIIMVTAFSFGWLTKGPIAIIIPGISIIFTLLLCKKFPSFSIKEIVISLAIFLLVLAPWHIAVYKNYGMSAFNWLYLQGNIGRFIGQHNAYNFGHKPTYMLTTLLGNFLPWTIFLIPAIVQLVISLFSKKYSYANSKFLLLLFVWSIFNTLIFSLSSSNWNYYSLPIYPALAIITAHFLNALSDKYSHTKIRAIYIIIAIGFLIAMTVYTSVFLPIKSKRDTYLNFALQVKKSPVKIPFYFHLDLLEQSLLTDYVAFESGRLPVYRDQETLKKLLLNSQSFIVLIPKRKFEDLQSSSHSQLKILETESYKWLNFPGCKLVKESAPGTPISVILASYNPKP